MSFVTKAAVGFPKVEIGGGTGKPTVVFLAGFPDDQESSWGPHLRAKMEEEYHVLFLCLPGFEKGGVPKRWGYTFDELLDLMHFTIQQATRKDEQIFLVGHDWGSYVAHKYQNKFPEKVKKLVLVDVGMIKLHTASLEQMLFIAMYQSWFAISFLVSQLISRFVGHIMLLLFGLPFFAPLFKGLWEGTEVGDRMRRDDKVVLRCYPYFQLWKLLLTNTIVYPHFPTCPLLYLYGTEKRFMFHDQEFLSTIRSKKECKELGLPCAVFNGEKNEERGRRLIEEDLSVVDIDWRLTGTTIADEDLVVVDNVEGEMMRIMEDDCYSPVTDTDSVIFEVDFEAAKVCQDVEVDPSGDNPQTEPEDVVTPVPDITQPRSDRVELRLLAEKRGKLPRLINLMNSHRTFISRSDRTLIIRALQIYQRNTSKDIRPAIGALRASTSSVLEQPIRQCIALYLTDLMILFGATLDEETAPTDQERFAALFEDNKLTQQVWNDLLAMGIVWCNTVPSLQLVELVGTSTTDVFTSEVIARWGFENPTPFFHYTQETGPCLDMALPRS